MKFRAICLMLLIATGCGDGSGLEPIQGVVAYDGQPVPMGFIIFYPERGRPASAKLDSEGRYALSSYAVGDGVPPGEYQVVVRAVESIPLNGGVAEEYEYGYGGPQQIRWLVPQRYSEIETTPLTATVTADGNQIINFDIPKE